MNKEQFVYPSLDVISLTDDLLLASQKDPWCEYDCIGYNGGDPCQTVCFGDDVIDDCTRVTCSAHCFTQT